METISELEKTKEYLIKSISEYNTGTSEIHPYDLAQSLQNLRTMDSAEYKAICKSIPSNLFALILVEMPTYVQEEIANVISERKVANITSKMDSDDASSLIYNIAHKDESTAENILSKLNTQSKEIIEELNAHDEKQVGFYMQKELFNVHIDENIGRALKRLKREKEANTLNNIFHAYIIDNNDKLIGSIGLEELILYEHSLCFKDIPMDKMTHNSINHKHLISEAIDMFTNYSLSALAIVDENENLVGRLTHDDIQTLIQQQNTKQLYSLAGVNDKKEEVESIFEIGKNRAFWLGINLLTAILASFVIGIFDETIQSLVALAILMPIVASMGGNAGTQTLTVTVRQMTLGEISSDDAKKTIYKEVVMSLINGLLFAFVIGLISYLWFKIPLLGVVIAISMVINLASAGFFGAVIPLALNKLGIDPAIGSTVILTTVTDIVGFFTFLGLSTLILL